MDDEYDDFYSLDELLKVLEEVRGKGEEKLNCPKAIYSLAKEMERVREIIRDYLRNI